jgi:hypothetical protein
MLNIYRGSKLIKSMLSSKSEEQLLIEISTIKETDVTSISLELLSGKKEKKYTIEIKFNGKRIYYQGELKENSIEIYMSLLNYVHNIDKKQ